MEFTPFRAGHLKFLEPQPAQLEDFRALRGAEETKMLEDHISLSGWNGSACVGAGGLIPIWPHRAVAWLLLSKDAGPHMLTIARKFRRVVRASPFDRVEMTVRADFEAGQRLMKIAGAVCETPEPMEFYGGDRSAAYMYRWLREDI